MRFFHLRVPSRNAVWGRCRRLFIDCCTAVRGQATRFGVHGIEAMGCEKFCSRGIVLSLGCANTWKRPSYLYIHVHRYDMRRSRRIRRFNTLRGLHCSRGVRDVMCWNFPWFMCVVSPNICSVAFFVQHYFPSSPPKLSEKSNFLQNYSSTAMT